MTREELEAIKLGDVIVTPGDWLSDYKDEYHKVKETRVRCGEQGDVLDDYLITEDGEEINYTRIKAVVD